MVRELAPLFTFFSNLLMYEYMPDKSKETVARELGINPFFVRDYVEAAQRYPAGKTFRIIGYLRPIPAFGKDRQIEAAKRTYSSGL